jgi:hypothetical protein
VPVGTIRREGFGTLFKIEKTGFPYPVLEMSGQNPNAAGPDQGRIRQDPNYLLNEYPDLAYWSSCSVVPPGPGGYAPRPLLQDNNQDDTLLPFEKSTYNIHTIADMTKSVFVEMHVIIHVNSDESVKPYPLPQRVLIEVYIDTTYIIYTYIYIHTYIISTYRHDTDGVIYVFMSM